MLNEENKSKNQWTRVSFIDYWMYMRYYRWIKWHLERIISAMVLKNHQQGSSFLQSPCKLLFLSQIIMNTLSMMKYSPQWNAWWLGRNFGNIIMFCFFLFFTSPWTCIYIVSWIVLLYLAHQCCGSPRKWDKTYQFIAFKAYWGWRI